MNLIFDKNKFVNCRESQVCYCKTIRPLLPLWKLSSNDNVQKDFRLADYAAIKLYNGKQMAATELNLSILCG